MARGKITFIERPKGYGFIETEVGLKVFFHQRWLKKIKFRDLQIGDEVVFSINRGPRGPRAYNLSHPSEEGEPEPVARPIEAIFKD
jgi:cold shock CspA family protein